MILGIYFEESTRNFSVIDDKMFTNVEQFKALKQVHDTYVKNGGKLSFKEWVKKNKGLVDNTGGRSAALNAGNSYLKLDEVGKANARAAAMEATERTKGNKILNVHKPSFASNALKAKMKLGEAGAWMKANPGKAAAIAGTGALAIGGTTAAIIAARKLKKEREKAAAAAKKA